MANDVKQLCAINKRLSDAGIKEIVPDIIDAVKERRIQRTRKAVDDSLNKVQKNYGDLLTAIITATKILNQTGKLYLKKINHQKKLSKGCTTTNGLYIQSNQQ